MTHSLITHMEPHRRSIVGEMSVLATATGTVNLGQGFPDTAGPDLVRDAAIEAIREGRGAQYPPAHGLPELRAAICMHQESWYDLSWDAGTDGRGDDRSLRGDRRDCPGVRRTRG